MRHMIMILKHKNKIPAQNFNLQQNISFQRVTTLIPYSKRGTASTKSRGMKLTLYFKIL
jgi:hypothetical protein